MLCLRPNSQSHVRHFWYHKELLSKFFISQVLIPQFRNKLREVVEQQGLQMSMFDE